MIKHIMVVVALAGCLSLKQMNAMQGNANPQYITAVKDFVARLDNGSNLTQSAIEAKQALEKINYSNLTPLQVGSLCSLLNEISYCYCILGNLNSIAFQEGIDEEDLEIYHDMITQLDNPQCLHIQDLKAAGTKLKTTHNISIKKVRYNPYSTISPTMYEYVATGAQTEPLKRENLLPVHSASPKPYKSSVFITPTFYNASSKSMNIKVNNEKSTSLSPAATWATYTANNATISVESTGFAPIKINLQTDIPRGTIYVALDAGKLLFGSKIPQSPKLAFKPMNKIEALKAYPKLKPFDPKPTH